MEQKRRVPHPREKPNQLNNDDTECTQAPDRWRTTEVHTATLERLGRQVCHFVQTRTAACTPRRKQHRIDDTPL
jgi:hypothetical protein